MVFRPRYNTDGGRKAFMGYKHHAQNFNNKYQNFNYDHNALGNKQLATLYNPFSHKNHQPKWPDGKCQFSIGRKHQAASEVAVSDCVVALFPGAINWCLVLNKDGDNYNVEANHTSSLSIHYLMRNLATTLAYQWYIPDESHFSAWRPVSYAMTIRNINNDENNDGWFEAIRTPRNAFLAEMGLTAPSDNQDTTPIFHPGSILPSTNLCNKWMLTNRWTDQPTYVTGKLKDIGNYVFQLNHQKRNNDFLKFRTLNLPVTAVQTPADNTYRIRDDADNTVASYVLKDINAVEDPEIYHNDQLQDSLYHDCLDVIIVRIHGIPLAGDGTKLLIHSVANMEFLVDENSEFAQYTSSSYPAYQGLNTYLDYRLKFNKTPMHTNKYNYSGYN